MYVYAKKLLTRLAPPSFASSYKWFPHVRFNFSDHFPKKVIGITKILSEQM